MVNSNSCVEGDKHDCAGPSVGMTIMSNGKAKPNKQACKES